MPTDLLSHLQSAECAIQKLWDNPDWLKNRDNGEPFVEAIATHNRIHDIFLKISKRIENMEHIRNGGRF